MMNETPALHVGDCDTQILPIWKDVEAYFPDAKWIFLVRDKAEVIESCNNQRLASSGIDWLDAKLGEAIQYGDGLVVEFDDLFTLNAMTEIWWHLDIEDDFPYQRFELLKEMQINDGLMRDGRFRNTYKLSSHDDAYTELVAGL
jgi:hypothetical protein